MHRFDAYSSTSYSRGIRRLPSPEVCRMVVTPVNIATEYQPNSKERLFKNNKLPGLIGPPSIFLISKHCHFSKNAMANSFLKYYCQATEIRPRHVCFKRPKACLFFMRQTVYIKIQIIFFSHKKDQKGVFHTDKYLLTTLPDDKF